MNTQEFFEELYRGIAPEKVTYCYTLPGKKCYPFPIARLDELGRKAMELSGAENVYFGLHLTDTFPKQGHRVCADEITCVAFIHGEYDIS